MWFGEITSVFFFFVLICVGCRGCSGINSKHLHLYHLYSRFTSLWCVCKCVMRRKAWRARNLQRKHMSIIYFSFFSPLREESHNHFSKWVNGELLWNRSPPPQKMHTPDLNRIVWGFFSVCFQGILFFFVFFSSYCNFSVNDIYSGKGELQSCLSSQMT